MARACTLYFDNEKTLVNFAQIQGELNTSFRGSSKVKSCFKGNNLSCAKAGKRKKTETSVVTMYIPRQAHNHSLRR